MAKAKAPTGRLSSLLGPEWNGFSAEAFDAILACVDWPQMPENAEHPEDFVYWPGVGDQLDLMAASYVARRSLESQRGTSVRPLAATIRRHSEQLSIALKELRETGFFGEFAQAFAVKIDAVKPESPLYPALLEHLAALNGSIHMVDALEHSAEYVLANAPRNRRRGGSEKAAAKKAIEELAMIYGRLVGRRPVARHDGDLPWGEFAGFAFEFFQQVEKAGFPGAAVSAGLIEQALREWREWLLSISPRGS